MNKDTLTCNQNNKFNNSEYVLTIRLMKSYVLHLFVQKLSIFPLIAFTQTKRFLLIFLYINDNNSHFSCANCNVYILNRMFEVH